jgi:tRNA pseudouridine55 synthase
MDGQGGGGVLLVSKPAGITSHDVVERIRRSPIARGSRVGHAGTLDPFATGLLVILVGKATRVQRFVMALPKTYRTRARFGVVSDSGDPTGCLTATGAGTDESAVRKELGSLTGDIHQRVPLTSAVKVGGERLYRKARRGERVEAPVRAVHVSRLDLVAFDSTAQTAELELECSSGTYVRQLVQDLGDLCGAGAYCEALERLAIGPFRIERADERRLIPLREALSFLPERALAPQEARRVRNGGAIEDRERPDGEQADTFRLTAEGELIAVAERRDGTLKPVTVLDTGDPAEAVRPNS